MRNTKLPVKDIKRAQVRYFQSDINACEIPEIGAYAYFLKIKDTYINILNPFEDCNIYERVPYPNFTKDGEDFGSKIKLVNGTSSDGICYILDSGDASFSNKPFISIEEFENIIINLDIFIPDRIKLIESKSYVTSTMVKRLIKDKKIYNKFEKYLNSKEKENEKKLKK